MTVLGDDAELSHAPHEQERYLRGMEALVSTVRELASAQDLNHVVSIVRDRTRDLTGADGATFVLRDEDQCHYVEENAIAPLWAGRRFSIHECISGWAMLNRQTAAIEDIYVDDRIPHDAYRPTFVKSLVMVPVRAEESIAAIGSYWADRHVATPAELGILQALADSTAVAIENVTVHAELEARVEERTAQLQRAYHDLEQLALGVTHDLRNPLATIDGFAELLRIRHGAALGGDGLELVGAVERCVSGMQDLVMELQTYARAGSRTLELTSVELKALVAEVLERLGDLIDSSGLTVECGQLPEVPVDRLLFTQVIQNLIANAAIHAVGRTPPVVRLAAERPPTGGWEITVADNGPGIPDDEKEAVFEPFARGSGSGDRQGSGLGLAICARIAERHGGTITVGDAPAGGAKFTVRLPDPAHGT